MPKCDCYCCSYCGCFSHKQEKKRMQSTWDFVRATLGRETKQLQKLQKQREEEEDQARVLADQQKSVDLSVKVDAVKASEANCPDCFMKYDEDDYKKLTCHGCKINICTECMCTRVIPYCWTQPSPTGKEWLCPICYIMALSPVLTQSGGGAERPVTWNQMRGLVAFHKNNFDV